MRFRTAFFWLLLLTSTAPADPSWWAAQGVKTTAPAANMALATIGQAKHMAAMALAELAGHLDAPAFQALQTDLAAIVDLTLPNPLPPGFHDSQRAILLTGQLKAIAKPFYDHLRTHDAAWLDNAMTLGNLIVMEPGSNPPTPSPYPWSEATTDDVNKAPATLGQLKAVFSLPLETLATTPAVDTDGDGIPDAWEIQNGFNPNNSADATGDADDDGINNLLEFRLGLSPNSVDIVGPVNLGFYKEITDFPTLSFRPSHPSDLYEAGDQSSSSVSGWKAAMGQHIEIWDEGNGNPYAELQSHLGAHGITQEFWMLPGTSVTFILRYKGRYDSWDGVIDNAFSLKLEGAEAFELRVNGDVVTSNNSVRSHAFMESDTGNQWASWHSATVTITELGNGNSLAPFLLSLVPNTTTSDGEEITHGGFVDIAPVINLSIATADPFTPSFISEENEETVGAFVVANLNDHDGDGVVDADDNSIRPEGGVGKYEQDLITLKIDGPPDGQMKVEVASGQVRFWKLKTKESEYPIQNGSITINGNNLPMTLYVEAIAKSAELRDIVLDLVHIAPDGTVTGNLDRVKATAVWVEQKSFRNTAGLGLWTATHDTKFADTFNYLIAQWGINFNPQDPRQSFRYSIGIEFELFPHGISQEPGVKFDVARDIAFREWNVMINPYLATPTFIAGINDVLDPADMVDDDAPSDDEDVAGNDNRVYSLDGPGHRLSDKIADEIVSRNNFNEWVRVSFNGFRPSGNNNLGSRCSEKFKWHAHYHVEWDVSSLKYKQKGNMLNSVDTNHIPLGVAPNP